MVAKLDTRASIPVRIHSWVQLVGSVRVVRTGSVGYTRSTLMSKPTNWVVVDAAGVVGTRLVYSSGIAVESGRSLRSTGHTSGWGSLGSADCGFTARSSCVEGIVMIVVLSNDGVFYFVEEASHIE